MGLLHSSRKSYRGKLSSYEINSLCDLAKQKSVGLVKGMMHFEELLYACWFPGSATYAAAYSGVI